MRIVDTQNQVIEEKTLNNKIGLQIYREKDSTSPLIVNRQFVKDKSNIFFDTVGNIFGCYVLDPKLSKQTRETTHSHKYEQYREKHSGQQP